MINNGAPLPVPADRRNRLVNALARRLHGAYGLSMSLLPLIALAQAAFGSAPVASYDGQCTYPAGRGEPRPGEMWVTCSRLVADAEGVDFRDRGWDRSMLRFAGEWDGDRLTVRSVVPRTGGPVEARGLCRTYYADEEVSVIACAARSGGRLWIGNFKVSRI